MPGRNSSSSPEVVCRQAEKERVDVFTVGRGTFELPVMGVVELADGKIKAWRDHVALGRRVFSPPVLPFL